MLEEYLSMPSYCIRIVLSFLLCCVFTCTSDKQVCYAPNDPDGGYHMPPREIYKIGDFVDFRCDEKHFPLSQNSSEPSRSTCQGSGTWSSVEDTFCDGPPLVPIDVQLTTRDEQTSDVTAVTDSNIDSCHDTSRSNRITWLFSLARRSLISVVRIYGIKGESYRLEVIAAGPSFGTDQRSCGFQELSMEQNGWIVYQCPEDTWSDKVFVKDWERTQHFLKLCEVQIFSRKNIVSPCQPPTNSIPHGYLKYRRKSAELVCRKGYKPNSEQDIVCHKSVWETSGHFCTKDDESNKKFVVLILCSTLGSAVLLVLVFVVVLLLCRHKRHLRKISSESSTGSTSRPVFSNLVRYSRESSRTNRHKSEEHEDPAEHVYNQVRYSEFLGKVQLPVRMPTYVNY